MANKHANILTDEMFSHLMSDVAKSEHGLRDQVMIALSFKAGLRSQEIAGLEWKTVCDANGAVRGDALFVPSSIAKGSREATIPMHPYLFLLLRTLRALRQKDRYVIYPTKPGFKGKKLSPNAVTKWFERLYGKYALDGCSSHSGRRTFITQAARRAGNHDCSIRDVQFLARHSSLSTTERYIEPSKNVGRLVADI